MSLPSESLSGLPIAVIGAGPVGLAAAARLLERGLTPLVLEKGAHAGAAMASWGHVRVFSPWGFNIDDSIAAELAGDREAARRVELVLPETGVCSLRPPAADAPQERAGKASACRGAR